MEIQDIRNNLDLLPDEIEKLEQAYLESKAQLDYLKDLTKHRIAKWKGEFSGSNADREQAALAKDDYANHLEAIKVQANTVARNVAVFHKMERRFEAMRSLNKNI